MEKPEEESVVHLCFSCRKEMTDDEYVVGWGYCSECWNKSLDDYKKSQVPIKE